MHIVIQEKSILNVGLMLVAAVVDLSVTNTNKKQLLTLVVCELPSSKEHMLSVYSSVSVFVLLV